MIRHCLKEVLAFVILIRRGKEGAWKLYLYTCTLYFINTRLLKWVISLNRKASVELIMHDWRIWWRCIISIVDQLWDCLNAMTFGDVGRLKVESMRLLTLWGDGILGKKYGILAVHRSPSMQESRFFVRSVEEKES